MHANVQQPGPTSTFGVVVVIAADTEIDWRAYMQEVEGWIGGDTDYMNLKGDTGPLVYPAGFMYVYRALRWATDGGVDIRAAQWIFLGVYLATQWLVLDIYSKARPGPPWVTILLCLSKRIHSLYVLRLFNDCVAMLLFYAAMSLMLRHKVRGATADHASRTLLNTLVRTPVNDSKCQRACKCDATV